MIRIYQRRQPYPIEIPTGAVVAHTAEPEVRAVLSVADAAAQVLAWIPLEQVVGWVFGPEPIPRASGTLICVRGREAPIGIDAMVWTEPPGRERSRARFTDGWQGFYAPQGALWARFRIDEITHWELRAAPVATERPTRAPEAPLEP